MRDLTRQVARVAVLGTACAAFLVVLTATPVFAETDSVLADSVEVGDGSLTNSILIYDMVAYDGEEVSGDGLCEDAGCYSRCIDAGSNQETRGDAGGLTNIPRLVECFFLLFLASGK